MDRPRAGGRHRLRPAARRQRRTRSGSRHPLAALRRARCEPRLRPGRLHLARPAVARTRARRRGALRTAHRHVHARRHLRRRHRAARPPRRPRHHPRRGHAGQRRQRRLELGIRRRRLVRRARAAGRAGRLQAVRRRRTPQGSGGHAGRRLQPPRSVRELLAAVRAVPEVRTQHVGRSGQCRGARGTRLHHRQRVDVAAGLSRRRVAPGRRPRVAGRLADPHPRRAGDARRRAAPAGRPAADPDRRVRSQRPGDDRAAAEGIRPGRAMGRRRAPRPAFGTVR